MQFNIFIRLVIFCFGIASGAASVFASKFLLGLPCLDIFDIELAVSGCATFLLTCVDDRLIMNSSVMQAEGFCIVFAATDCRNSLSGMEDIDVDFQHLGHCANCFLSRPTVLRYFVKAPQCQLSFVTFSSLIHRVHHQANEEAIGNIIVDFLSQLVDGFVVAFHMAR